MTTPSEFLTLCTLRIEAQLNGNAIGYGTGFCYTISLEENSVAIFLVTNKHVINGATHAHVSLHKCSDDEPSEASGDTVTRVIDLSALLPIQHPDPNVDLCAIPLGPAMNTGEDKESIFMRYLSRENIPSDDEWRHFDALEQVTMIGYPNALFDHQKQPPYLPTRRHRH